MLNIASGSPRFCPVSRQVWSIRVSQSFCLTMLPKSERPSWDTPSIVSAAGLIAMGLSSLSTTMTASARPSKTSLHILRAVFFTARVAAGTREKYHSHKASQRIQLPDDGATLQQHKYENFVTLAFLM